MHGQPWTRCGILTCMGSHGHVVAGLLEEMRDVRGYACFENCETEFRYSRCKRQGIGEAPSLREKVPNAYLRKAERKWEASEWGDHVRRWRR